MTKITPRLINEPIRGLSWEMDYFYHMKRRTIGCWHATAKDGTQYVIVLGNSPLATPFSISGGCSGFSSSFSGASDIAEQDNQRRMDVEEATHERDE